MFVDIFWCEGNTYVSFPLVLSLIFSTLCWERVVVKMMIHEQVLENLIQINVEGAQAWLAHYVMNLQPILDTALSPSSSADSLFQSSGFWTVFYIGTTGPNLEGSQNAISNQLLLKNDVTVCVIHLLCISLLTHYSWLSLMPLVAWDSGNCSFQGHLLKNPSSPNMEMVEWIMKANAIQKPWKL